MLAASPTVLLALALITGATATAQPNLAPCEPGPRRIELNTEPTGKVPELCIGAGLSTTFTFEGGELFVEGVSVEGRDRFTRVEVSATMLRLVPSESVAPGERFKLTVRFKDGAAPASAIFWLEVYPGQAEPLVEVYRQKRTVESCQQEVKEKQAQLRQCREDNARLQAEKSGPGGLAQLIATRLMGREGVFAKTLNSIAKPHSANALEVMDVHSYRSDRTVAVELLLATTEAAPSWTAVKAELVGPGRRTLRNPRLWQERLSTTDTQQLRVVVEAEATGTEAQGSFTLTVWSEGGTGNIVVTGVTFP
jgi:uncharacterized protein (TIGR02268 family)